MWCVGREVGPPSLISTLISRLEGDGVEVTLPVQDMYGNHMITRLSINDSEKDSRALSSTATAVCDLSARVATTVRHYMISFAMPALAKGQARPRAVNSTRPTLEPAHNDVEFTALGQCAAASGAQPGGDSVS